jgi:phosphate uptake regulator/predicted site-specific integrase-resolvase
MKAPSVKPVRCAIYTRVSTEQGLDQEFNSLDAQYDAASAYIKSQAHAGWTLIRSRSDDGGYSGGSTDRPDLQRLLADIRARKIDVIVVYKVDRLTRSLADFAKLVELFDAHGVSFVSVTQQFNTTTSMGRLTLNVLLSLAQFEREVTSERIRDAMLFIGLLDVMAQLLKKLLPNRVKEADPLRPRYLDESALETPSLALADAARETLHMGDLVEIMLRKVMAAMMNNDRALVDQVSRMDNNVDALDEAIKLYLTKLTRGSLDEREGRRAMEIISFTINLEHIGDIIDKNLSELATKKIKRRFQFSPEGAEELSAFHKRTMDSLRIAFGVFMSGNVDEARKLLAEKAVLRNTELAATEKHLDRLREGRPETIETTSLHLDVLRDLRRIHSHICSVAYPVLEATGELSANRSGESEAVAISKPAEVPLGR